MIRLVSGKLMLGGVLYSAGDELPDIEAARAVVRLGKAVEDMPVCEVSKQEPKTELRPDEPDPEVSEPTHLSSKKHKGGDDE